MSTPFDSSTDSDDGPRRRKRPFASKQRQPALPVPASATLECRFSREVYVVIGIWILTGLGFQISAPFAPRTNSIWEMTAICTVFFHVPNLFFIFWVERIRVWADENGLRLRGLWNTRFIAWKDIEDYGWKLAPANSKSQMTGAVLFIRGRRKPKHLSRNLTRFDELLERIAQRATNARVSSWQPLEARDEGEWPKIFSYHDVSGWKLFASYLGFAFTLCGLILAQVFVSPRLSGVNITWNSLVASGKIGLLAMPLLICVTYPLMILARYPAIKAARRFLEQRIIATREGLTFERGDRQEFVAWGDIERYELETPSGNFQFPLGIIHTKRDRYEFHTGIVKGRELRALICYRATNATTSKWMHGTGGDADVLGGPNSMWRGGIVGVGPRIHHYHTRTNRIMLIFGALLAAPMPYFAIYGRYVHGVWKAPDIEDYIMTTIFLLLLVPPTLWGTLSYWYSTVEVDEAGLKQRGIWGERMLSWSQIRSAKFNGYVLEVRGEKTVLRIGPVADQTHLIEEIERHSGIKIQRVQDFKVDA
ncbi:hypothetical protein EON83_21750 [bacterium]|nr:MAG: hypothetical protein EON83_21750 [bacterium]